MKQKFLLIVVVVTLNLQLLTFNVFSQGVAINADGSNPDASAMLDVKATNKGMLIPRVSLTSTTDVTTIPSPATSLLVYNTATAGISPNNVTPGYYYWNGTKWVAFGGSGGNDWGLLGNAGTTAGTNFIGTTDAQDLVFKTNSTEGMRITASGNVSIGTTAPLTKLHVNGTHPGAGIGNGSNSDAPTEAIIPNGSNGTERFNDWPSGLGGGLSTWDICGASTYFNQYLTRSDRRYKKDILLLEENKKDLVEKFMQIQPVSYFLNPETMKADPSELQRKRFGFIANDIEKLFPNLVINAGLPDSIYRGLEYDGFIPLLVLMSQQQQKVMKEQQLQIKEQQKMNDSLKKEVGSLQKENTMLKTELQQLSTNNEQLIKDVEKIKAYLKLRSGK